MLPVIMEMIEAKVSSIKTLHAYYTEAKMKRDSFHKFSVDFQYYWSLMAYMQDLIDHAPEESC